ncbi:MAG: family 78 glycoside hydrolase catalytic domain [Clostridia bacterium]|nr:family 78 glycoside hydrolase catalytic domain [Clostridia bacterium]
MNHNFRGKWIGADMTVEDRFAPVFKKDFNLSKTVKTAKIAICGLGLFELKINGRLPDDTILNPPHSQYTQTVFYRVFDITDLLEKGTNTITVELGHSFFNETTSVWNWDEAAWRSAPKLIADIDITCDDGEELSFFTDESWLVTKDGNTTANSIYYGETYDARRNDFGWDNAIAVDAPAGKLKEHTEPFIRRINEYKPKSITRLDDGCIVIESPEMITGWAKIRIDAPKDTVVTITYNEQLTEDGHLQKIGKYEGHDGNWWPDDYNQQDRFISNGEPFFFEPKFSYKGFRYIQIENHEKDISADDITIYRTANDVKTISDFECSDPLVNELHTLMRRTLLNNFQWKPTDTPVWEKNGWLGDANCALETMFYNFDMSEYMRQFVELMDDCFHDFGKVPVIVPTQGWGNGNSPVWNTIFVFATEALINFCGNKEFAQKLYPDLRKFALDDIRDIEGFGGTWRERELSDWLAPANDEFGEMICDPSEGAEICCTAYVYAMLRSMARISAILDNDDENEYLAQAEKIRKAFNEKFYNKEKQIYETSVWNPKGNRRQYRQTSNLLPLSFGMVDEENKAAVVKNLIDDIVSHDYHLDTGCTGTKHLLPVLFNSGHADIAYKVLSQTSYPSWGYWIKCGSTSAWEAWEPSSRSLDHYFLGTYDEALFSHIGGIRNVKDSYRKFTIAPETECGMQWAKTRLNSPLGTIRCEWKKENGLTSVEVEIPEGATAEIILKNGINETKNGGVYKYTLIDNKP